MPKIEIHSHEITRACILKVEVGTNCPQGGDSGHGGRTVLRLIDQAATDMEVSVDGSPLKSAGTIEIVLGGDCEAECFIEALEFAARTLRGQLGAPYNPKAVQEEKN